MQVGWHRNARAWAANVMEADSARGCLENSASGSLSITKTVVVAVSASTSGRAAGAKTAVTNRLSQSRAHERTCMGCQCHGGEQHQRQNVLWWQQPLRAQQLARIACVLALALQTGYDNPVHINARARAWAAYAMEDQSTRVGLVNSESAATSPSTSGRGAEKRLQ